MKLKLLLVFTICTMVSMAQTKSLEDTNLTLKTSSTTVNLNQSANYDKAVKLYPSVTEDLVHFTTSGLCGKVSISVFDLNGNKQKVKIDDGTINMSLLKKGMYFIQMSCSKFTVKKIVHKI